MNNIENSISNNTEFKTKPRVRIIDIQPTKQVNKIEILSVETTEPKVTKGKILSIEPIEKEITSEIKIISVQPIYPITSRSKIRILDVQPTRPVINVEIPPRCSRVRILPSE